MKRKTTYGKQSATFDKVEASLERILLLSERIQGEQRKILEEQAKIKYDLEVIKNRIVPLEESTRNKEQPLKTKTKIGWNEHYDITLLYEDLITCIIDTTSSQDFQLAFLGAGEPIDPIICRNGKIKQFVDVLVYLQQKNILPNDPLASSIADRSLSMKGAIAKHTIEEYISKCRTEGPFYERTRHIYSRLERNRKSFE